MFSASVKSMESATSSTGYKEPPWKFQGRQLHLVKSEVARALVPKEFRLVEAFGYTLGGFFLASYEDSPAGVFDELVVIAGLVWNPPTSCAWASRVLVSSNEACLHGRKDVGLPSHVARFSKSPGNVSNNNKNNNGVVKHATDGFLGRIGVAPERYSQMATEVTQLSDTLPHIFSINLINTVPLESSKRWMGPSVNMSLPSFSGRTKDNPCLLKYSCQMACRVRLVKPVRVIAPNTAAMEEETEQVDQTKGKLQTDSTHLSMLIMLSKPVLALEFNSMNMNVEAPLVIAD
ncbi:hypothetical protein V2J09_013226 [Rumex salicifolius]